MTTEEDYEIDLVELVKYLWKRKWSIILPCFLAAVLAVGFCIISLTLPPEKSYLPNKYTSKATILVNEGSSKGLSISGSLSSLASSLGYGSLLNSVSGGGSSTRLITLSETTSFKDEIINEFNLVERYKIKKHFKTESRKALDEVFLISEDKKNSNLIYVEFTDIDPAFAKRVVDFAVKLLLEKYYQFTKEDNLINKQNYETAMNDSYQRILEYQKAVHDLEHSVSDLTHNINSIMLDVEMKKLELEAEEKIYATFKANYEMLITQMANEPTDLYVIQNAEEPDKKSEPSRSIICLVAVGVVGFISCLVLFFKFSRISQEQTGLVDGFTGKDVEALR